MCADDVAVDTRVVVAKLDLDSSAQRRKHLGEDDLLVPHWLPHTHPGQLSFLSSVGRKHLGEDDLFVPHWLVAVLLH